MPARRVYALVRYGAPMDDEPLVIAIKPYDGGVAIERKMGPWTVRMDWPDDAEHGPRRMEIYPAEDSTPDEVQAGLSTTVLRRIDFKTARGIVDDHRMTDEERDGVHAIEYLRLAAADRSITDEYLVGLAAAYVELVKRREPNVTAKLAEITGKAPETIRIHLVRSRKAGFLTSVPGKAGGHLTDAARKILER